MGNLCYFCGKRLGNIAPGDSGDRIDYCVNDRNQIVGYAHKKCPPGKEDKNRQA